MSVASVPSGGSGEPRQMSTLTTRASCFENVTSIIFLAALSDYNSCLIEDRDSNGMHEALVLWESIVNSQCQFTLRLD